MSVGKSKFFLGLIYACVLCAPAAAAHPLTDADHHTLEIGSSNTHSLEFQAGNYLEIFLIPGTDPVQLEISGSFRVGTEQHSELTLAASEEIGRFAYLVVRPEQAPLTIRIWSDDSVLPTTSYQLKVNHIENESARVTHGMRASLLDSLSPADHEELAFDWESEGDTLLAMRHWFLAGTEHYNLRGYHDSDQALRRALDHAVSLNDEEAIAWIYRWISVLQKVKGEREDAIVSLCAGLKAISLENEKSCLPPNANARFSSPRAALVLANQIGLINHIKEEGKEAEQWYQAVLDIMNSSYPWQHQFAVTSNNFGGLEYQRGNYPHARARFRTAYDIHVKSGARENQMNMLSNLALVDQKTGKLDRAIDYYAQAIQISESLDLQISRGRVLHRLGTLNRKIGRLPRAEQLARQAQRLFESSNEAQGGLDALLLLGTVLFETGRYDEAQDTFTNALSAASTIQDNGGVIQSKTQLAEVALATGSVDEAFDLASQAQGLVIQKELTVELSEITNLQARIAEKSGNSDSAESLFRQARVLGESSPGDFVSASIGLARVLNERNPNEALGVIYEAKTSLSEWRQSAGDPFLDAEIVQKTSELMEQEVAAHFALFSETKDERYVTSALRASDSGQSQILDSLQRIGLTPNEKAEQITKEIATLVTQRVNEGDDDYDPHLEKLQLDLDVAVNVETRGRGHDQSVWRIPELQSNEAVLVYQVSEPYSFAWLITADNQTWTLLPGRNELYQLTSIAHQKLNSQGSRIEDLRELSEALLSSFSGSLNYDVLYVVPDEILHVIPFAALIKPHTDELLLDSTVVVNIPNLNWLGETPVSSTKSQSVLALGDPLYLQGTHAGSYFAGLQPLLWSKVEIASISKQFEQHTVHELQRERATKDAFLTELMESYSIIHLATHGIVDERFPELSGVVMSTTIDGVNPVDGFVSAREISSLDIDADLVVLSACDTGVGRNLAGEGPLSLSWSFLAAGANQVISSLWAVPDKSTSDLMIEFYRQLADEQLAPARALRAAQLNLKNNPRTRRPYHWAAFIITGNAIVDAELSSHYDSTSETPYARRGITRLQNNAQLVTLHTTAKKDL